jgi:uncharacterized protein DUF6152
MTRVALTTAVLVALVVPAAAHHGGGTFDGSKEIKLAGTFTGLDLINPHSWIGRWDAVDAQLHGGGSPDPCKELGFVDYSKEVPEDCSSGESGR